MREVLVVQIGTSGNRVGNAYFQRLAQEHQLSSDQQLGNYSTYFTQTNNSFLARAILIDTDCNALDQILCSKTYYSPDSFISIDGGQRSNYSYAYNELGFIAELAIDAIRRQAEICDSFQGFEVIHSLVGGSGSGLGAKIIQQIVDSYPNRALQSQIITPPSLNESVLEPYNFIFGFQSIIGKSTLVHFYDNKALYNILIKTQKVKNPGFEDLNNLIARSLSGNSCGFRFSEVNLVPYPKLNLILNSTSALPGEDIVYQNEQELYYMLMHRDRLMATTSINKHKFFTMHIQNRGLFTTSDAEYSIQTDRRRLLNPNFEYIPDKIKISYSDLKVDGQNRSATMQINSLAIRPIINQRCEDAQQMFKRKAFFYHFGQYGIDEQQMHEALQSCIDLKLEYENYDVEEQDEGEQYE